MKYWKIPGWLHCLLLWRISCLRILCFLCPADKKLNPDPSLNLCLFVCFPPVAIGCNKKISQFVTGFVNHISNTTGATCGAESAYTSGALEITPSFLVGFVLFILWFSVLCHVCCCLFVFFIFSHGVVSLF